MKPARLSKAANHQSDDEAEDMNLHPQHKFPTKRMTADEFFSNSSSPGSSAPSTPSPQKKSSSGTGQTNSNNKLVQPYYVKRNSISHQSAAAAIAASSGEGLNSHSDIHSSSWQELTQLPGITVKPRRGSHSSLGSGSDAGTVNSGTLKAEHESVDQQIINELQYSKLRKSSESTYVRRTEPKTSPTKTASSVIANKKGVNSSSAANKSQSNGSNIATTGGNMKRHTDNSNNTNGNNKVRQPVIPPPPSQQQSSSLMNTFMVLDDHVEKEFYEEDDDEYIHDNPATMTAAAAGIRQSYQPLDDEITGFAIPKQSHGDDSFYNDSEDQDDANADAATGNPMHTQQRSSFSIAAHEEDEMMDQQVKRRHEVEEDEDEITVSFKHPHHEDADEEDVGGQVPVRGKRGSNGYTSLPPVTNMTRSTGSAVTVGRDEYYNPFSASHNNLSTGDLESGDKKNQRSSSTYFEIGEEQDDDVELDYDDRYDVSAHNSLTSTSNEKVDRYRERGRGTSRGRSSAGSRHAVADFLANVVPQGVQDWSHKYPRFSITLLIGFCVIVPLLITVIALASSLSHPATGSLDSSSSNSNAADAWKEYYTSSYEGIVATDTKQCSEIGRDILKKGGNAVDAAVASTFCLGVISPASSGIGGGSYILIHQAKENKQIFIDAREVAPSGSYPTMFENDPMKAQLGGSSIAVLGEVKGLYRAYALYGSGKIPWHDLVQPAIQLAKRWRISRHLYFYLVIIQKHLLSPSTPFQNLQKLYTKRVHGELVLKEVDDYVEQPELAFTLENIATHGPDYLYVTMAETLAEEIQSAGGIMTKEDIMQYEPIIMDALKVDLAGYQYIGVGGSSSGGIIVVGLMKFMLSYLEPLTSLAESLYVHRLVESMKHLFAMRLSLGDPNYVNVTNVHNAILSESYIQHLQETLTSDEHIQASLYNYGGEFNMNAMMTKDAGTSHLSILDRDGNAVAMTTTVNNYFGSKVISSSTGILFNNEMDDFSVPGASNYFGLAPSPYNYPQPFKKPLSSMSPSIVLDKQNRVRIVGGGSGGPRIITATAQVLLNYLARGMDILSAMVHPRVHTQLLPDRVDVEHRTLVSGKTIYTPDYVLDALKARGHHNITLINDSMGVSQFIVIDPDSGLMEGVSDPRKDGAPAGI